MASKLSCNLCGKPFDKIDDIYGMNITIPLGSESRYDGCIFDGDFCCKCIDRIVANIAINCEINPISEQGGLLAESLEEDVEEP